MYDGPTTHLKSFLSRYYHRNWRQDAPPDRPGGKPNPDRILEKFLREGSPEQIQGVLAELQELQEREVGDTALEELCEGSLGCFYYPYCDGRTYTNWFERIREFLARGKPAQPAGSGPNAA
jgi:hypothetical protein